MLARTQVSKSIISLLGAAVILSILLTGCSKEANPTPLAGTAATPGPTAVSAPAALPTLAGTPSPANTQAPAPGPTSVSKPAIAPIPQGSPSPESAQTPIPAPTPRAAPSANSNPANVRYQWDGAVVRLTWEALDGTDYYNIYHSDDADSNCRVDAGGAPSNCNRLVAGVLGTAYVHTRPDLDRNYYWVSACNSGGCSSVDSGNPASPSVPELPVPSAPGNAQYEWNGAVIRLTWDAVAGAEFYKVYYDDFSGDSCVVREGRPSFCKELSGGAVAAAYVHTKPDMDRNYYWVAACNSGGCSGVDGDNPAREHGNSQAPADGNQRQPSTIASPPAPGNAQYEWIGPMVRLTWDIAAGADYYRVYHDGLFDDNCTVREGRPSFCEELTGGAVGTAYIHTEPDADRNYYWVAACNSGGCSGVDSGNPANAIVESRAGAGGNNVARSPAGKPAPPADSRYEWVNSMIRLTWDPVAGADYYGVFHDDFFGPDAKCPNFCKELAGGIVGTGYLHVRPAMDRSHNYWIVACNAAGCSGFDPGNRARSEVVADAWVLMGATPLHRAAFESGTGPVEELLDQGASVGAVAGIRHNETDLELTGLTPLHYAALNNSEPSVVALLLEGGAPVGAESEHDGVTPLHLAAAYNPEPGVASLLLDRGADIEAADREGQAPLVWAGLMGNLSAAQLLLDRGADVAARSDTGSTSLHAAAAFQSNTELIVLLLDRGADIKAADESGGTPLHFAAINPEQSVATLLLDRGAEIEARTNTGRTPLHVAVLSENSEVIALLLDRGASVQAKDERGLEPLHWAAGEGLVSTAVQLLGRGAGIEARTEGADYTPLHLAIGSEQPEMAAQLVARGADVNAATNDGWTPLHFAIWVEDEEMVSLLLERGADRNAESSDGVTPCELARESGRFRGSNVIESLCAPTSG